MSVSSLALAFSGLAFLKHRFPGQSGLFTGLCLSVCGRLKNDHSVYFSTSDDEVERTNNHLWGGKFWAPASLYSFQGNQFHPVAFIDDNPLRQGSILNGLRVYPTVHLAEVIERYGARRILLALGNTPRSKRSVILRFWRISCTGSNGTSMGDIISGKATIAEVKDVEIEDLLGRDEVTPIPELISKCITIKVVMVTGAGGSVGPSCADR